MPPIYFNAGIVVEFESKLNRLILPGCTRQPLPHPSFSALPLYLSLAVSLP